MVSFLPASHPEKFSLRLRDPTPCHLYKESSQRGWLIAKRHADNKGLDYTYTPAGRLKILTWANNRHTRYDYRFGLLAAIRHFNHPDNDDGSNTGIDCLTPDVAYTYNPFGQLVNAVTASNTAHPGTWIHFTYDSSLRLLRERVRIDPDLSFTLPGPWSAPVIHEGPVPPPSSGHMPPQGRWHPPQHQRRPSTLKLPILL